MSFIEGRISLQNLVEAFVFLTGTSVCIKHMTRKVIHTINVMSTLSDIEKLPYCIILTSKLFSLPQNLQDTFKHSPYVLLGMYEKNKKAQKSVSLGFYWADTQL